MAKPISLIFRPPDIGGLSLKPRQFQAQRNQKLHLLLVRRKILVVSAAGLG
jgi:hypothetical protein